MNTIIQHITFIASLTLLIACSEADNTAAKTAPAPATITETETETLILSLPEETISDQTTPLTNEPPLLPELFNQQKETSKYQLEGQVLLKEKAPLGVEALDGAKVSITVKQ